MNLDEFSEFLKKYEKNPELINDDNYFKQLVDTLNKFYKEDSDNLEILFKNNEGIMLSIYQNKKFINYALESNNQDFFDDCCYLFKPIELVSMLNVDKVIKYLKTNSLPPSWEKNKDIFEYIQKFDKEVAVQFNIKHIFSEITEETLDKYGKVILEYIKNNYKNFPYSWKINKNLFEYIYINDKKLLQRVDFSLGDIFPEITDDVLNKYNSFIISYCKEFGIPFEWYNKDLFKCLVDNSAFSTPNLDDVFYRSFSEFTGDTLEEYGECIIKYLKQIKYPYYFFSKFREKRNLFEYLIEKNETNLAAKFPLSDYFHKITKEILDKYGNSILIYAQKNIIPKYWCNKELYEYVKENDETLLSKFDLSIIFPEITNDILDKYGKYILEYCKSVENVPSEWAKSEKLLEYIRKIDDTVFSYIDFSIIFPELTDEILNKYGKYILDFIEIWSYSPWGNDEKLFKYVYANRKNLTSRCFDLFSYFPIITNDILNDYGDVILDYIKVNSQNIPDSWLLSPELAKFFEKNSEEAYYLQSQYFNSNSEEKKEKFLTFFANMLNIQKEVLKYKLEYLYSKNDELDKTINLSILDNRFSKIKMNMLSKITLYPYMQKQIIDLSTKTLDFFCKILEKLDSPNYDLASVVLIILNNIKNYDDFFNNNKIEDLEKEKTNNLIYVLLRKDNVFNITDIDDLSDDNFKIKKNEYFSNIEKDIDNISLKVAIFEKIYALPLEQVMTIYEKYCCIDSKELIESGIDKRIINILEGIKTILEEKSEDNLKSIYLNSDIKEADFYELISLEALIRKEYAALYNKKLYKINDTDKSKDLRLQNVKYKDKQIQFYEPSGDFNMQIHGLGAYNPRWESPENYYNDWNMPKITYHGICTSYIGNNQIANARLKGPVLGFSSYENSALLLSGNYDLASNAANTSFNPIEKLRYRGQFLPPKLMIDSTRHNHNEMVIERINKDTAISFKRQPNYIVYIIDDIENENNFSQDNEYYKNTLQCAADMNLPIVIIDRKKYAISEKRKCEQLEKEYNETGNLNILKELFLTYMNNNVGCRKFEEQEECEYHTIFSNNVIIDFYNRILNNIINKMNNISLYDEDVLKKLEDEILLFIELTKNEIKNYKVAHQSHRVTPPVNFEKEMDNLKVIYYQYKAKYYKLKENNYQEEIDEKNKIQK